jgi:hypothetical protein
VVLLVSTPHSSMLTAGMWYGPMIRRQTLNGADGVVRRKYAPISATISTPIHRRTPSRRTVASLAEVWPLPALTASPQALSFDPASRPAAAPQRARAALSCAPVSHCGFPAARRRGLLPVTPRQACPVAPAILHCSLLAAGWAPCQPPGEGLGRRPVASSTPRVPSRRDCGTIAFAMPILSALMGQWPFLSSIKSAN